MEAALLVASPAHAEPARSSETAASWGVRASIPLHVKSTSVRGGQKITVRAVRSKRRGSRVVRVELAQKVATGSRYRKVTRKKARSGRLSVEIPTSGSAHLKLTVRVASQRYRVALKRKAEKTGAAKPSPAPTPAPPVIVPPIHAVGPGAVVLPTCFDPNAVTGTPSGALISASDQARAGDEVWVHLFNTTLGTRCLFQAEGSGWERFDDGAWIAAPPASDDAPPTHSTPEGFMIAPGAAKSWRTVVPAHLPAGRYRIGQFPTTRSLPGQPQLPPTAIYGELEVID